MNIALMTGAYVNAGDFLIEQRSKALLEKILQADVTLFRRNESYDSRIGELNRYDGIVFGGGPLFQNIYPDKMPFVSRLEEINTPVFILGGGWKSRDCSDENIYSGYRLKDKMTVFVRFVSAGGGISCRDWYTVRMLRNMGIFDPVMTGCPAWYDTDRIENLELKEIYREASVQDDIMIGISDPAMPWNQNRLLELLRILLRSFPKAKLKVFFHRGIPEENRKKMEKLCGGDGQISFQDISGSCEGFSQYDDCFLHIGFRVHAHIYNLSRGNVSILINEDARGNGVNQALGIENIDCGQRKPGFHRMSEARFEQIITDYVRYVTESDYMQYRRAYAGMRETYRRMEDFIFAMQ